MVMHHKRTFQGSIASEICRLFAEETDMSIVKEMTELLEYLLGSSVDSKYYHDVLAIHRFLHHKQEFRARLDTLENELQTYVKTALPHLQLPINASGKLFIPCTDLSKTKCYKILSGYMYQWAGKNGFEFKAKLLDNLSSSTFCELLLTKTIIKDSSAFLISEHGMWSHSIQWWSVFQHHSETGFLQHSPMEIYQQFGGLRDGRLWNTVFDKGPTTSEYTSPEYVVDAISRDTENLPILCATIKRQKYKIEDTPTMFQQSYSRKLAVKHGEDYRIGFCKSALK
jgi:hypothetical protein